MDILAEFDRRMARAMRLLHARIDAHAKAALAEIKGKQFNRSLGQHRRAINTRRK